MPVNISWSKDGREIQSGDGVEIGRLGNRVRTLTVETVAYRHGGLYTCTARNAAGEDKQSSRLDVLVRLCGVFYAHSNFGYPSPLYPPPQLFQPTHGLVGSASGGRCVVGRAGSALGRSQTVLHVLAVKPQILALTFGDDPINSGDTAAVQCTVVKGDAPVKITWLFNGEEVVPGRRGMEVTKTGQKISALSVESVQAEHSGEYTCRASNKAGADSQTALLNVQGTLGDIEVLGAACSSSVDGAVLADV
ncbi:cell adhesion molecule Dscam2-like [Frankliniella occidentalis]|uniref:Cell adhesion molecule Dscam2-like n=1 Tax=Frankliniella occidentalis TaxID=133901 RepID=A0A9C6X526_FRAOC|nr:cell adhesion molecule Dscam2-like [Frankliniella occidentalis]